MESTEPRLANESGIAGLIIGVVLFADVYIDGIPSVNPHIFDDMGTISNYKGYLILGLLTITALILSIRGMMKDSEHYQKKLAFMGIILNSISTLSYLLSIFSFF